MSWRITCALALIGTLLSATAYADVIPFFGKRPVFTGYIQMHVERMPQDMVLIYLDKDGKLDTVAHQNEELRIEHKGTVYAVRESEFMQPFSFKKSKSKLRLLRKVEENDIPSAFGRPPRPVLLNCSMNEDALAGYLLACQKVHDQQ